MLLIVKFSKCTSDETLEFLSVLRLDIIKSKQFSMKVNQYQKNSPEKKTHTYAHTNTQWFRLAHIHTYTPVHNKSNDFLTLIITYKINLSKYDIFTMFFLTLLFINIK